MAKEKDWKAVLTGDIVSSSKINSDKRSLLFDALRKISEELHNKYPQDVSYPIANFRGDSWQLIVENPAKSLEICIYIRSFIKFTFKDMNLDSRIAVGIGSIIFLPESNNISSGDGPAFRTSGHLLDSLKSDRMAIGIAGMENDELNLNLSQIYLATDQNICSWNASQCQAIYWKLQNYTQTQISQKWLPESITQPAVSKMLASAGWGKVLRIIKYFEKVTNNTI